MARYSALHSAVDNSEVRHAELSDSFIPIRRDEIVHLLLAKDVLGCTGPESQRGVMRQTKIRLKSAPATYTAAVQMGAMCGRDHNAEYEMFRPSGAVLSLSDS
ncbi:MAG: hypothetical protein WKF37_02585 [Bryobacteraceae bacterium]